MDDCYSENHLGPFDSYLETLRQGALYTRVIRRYKVWNAIVNRFEWFLVVPAGSKVKKQKR